MKLWTKIGLMSCGLLMPVLACTQVSTDSQVSADSERDNDNMSNTDLDSLAPTQAQSDLFKKYISAINTNPFSENETLQPYKFTLAQVPMVVGFEQDNRTDLIILNHRSLKNLSITHKSRNLRAACLPRATRFRFFASLKTAVIN